MTENIKRAFTMNRKGSGLKCLTRLKEAAVELILIYQNNPELGRFRQDLQGALQNQALAVLNLQEKHDKAFAGAAWDDLAKISEEISDELEEILWEIGELELLKEADELRAAKTITTLVPKPFGC